MKSIGKSLWIVILLINWNTSAAQTWKPYECLIDTINDVVIVKKDTDIYVLQPFAVAVGYVLITDSLRQMVSLYENCEARIAIYDSLNVINNQIISNTNTITYAYKTAYEQEVKEHKFTKTLSRVKDVIWGVGVIVVVVLLL